MKCFYYAAGFVGFVWGLEGKGKERRDDFERVLWGGGIGGLMEVRMLIREGRKERLTN